MDEGYETIDVTDPQIRRAMSWAWHNGALTALDWTNAMNHDRFGPFPHDPYGEVEVYTT